MFPSKFLLVLSMSLILNFSVYAKDSPAAAEEPSTPRAPHPIKLFDIKEEAASSGTASDIVSDFSTSHDIDDKYLTPDAKKAKFQVKKNQVFTDYLTAEYIGIVEGLKKGTGEYAFLHGTKPADIEIIHDWYETGSKEVMDALIAAANLGIKIRWFLDPNVPLVNDNSEPSRDFNKLQANTSQEALRLAEAKKAGAKFRDPSAPINMLGQPVYKKGSGEIDIDHDKIFQLNVKGKPVRLITLTANMTDHESVNMGLGFKGETAGRWLDYFQDYFRDKEETYMSKSGPGRIKDMKETYSLQQNFPDGSWVRSGQTRGQQNMNKWLTDIMDAATAEPQKIKIAGMQFQHFVMTFSPAVESLRKLMTVQQDFEVEAVFDSKAVGNFTMAEMGSVFNGVHVESTLSGRVVRGFSKKLADRFKEKVYRRVVGQVSPLDPPPYAKLGHEVDPENDKPIYMHLQHVKLGMMDTIESDKAWTYISIGSLNWSGHSANSEYQWLFKVPTADPLAVYFKAYFKTVYNEPWAFEEDTDMARQAIASLIGVETLEVPLTWVKDTFMPLFKMGKYPELSAALDQLRGDFKNGKMTSYLTKKKQLSDAQYARYKGNAIEFMIWYKKIMEQFGKSYSVSLPNFLNVVGLLTNAHKGPGSIRQILDNLFYWMQGIAGPEYVEQMIQSAWTHLTDIPYQKEIPRENPVPTPTPTSHSFSKAPVQFHCDALFAAGA